jgi:hypothetical protein
MGTRDVGRREFMWGICHSRCLKTRSLETNPTPLFLPLTLRRLDIPINKSSLYHLGELPALPRLSCGYGWGCTSIRTGVIRPRFDQ